MSTTIHFEHCGYRVCARLRVHYERGGGTCEEEILTRHKHMITLSAQDTIKASGRGKQRTYDAHAHETTLALLSNPAFATVTQKVHTDTP